MNEDAMIRVLARVENEKALFAQKVPGAVGFDMDVWYNPRGESEGAPNICGTVACLAGHAAMMDGYQRFSASSCLTPDGSRFLDIEEAGQEVLGLSELAAENLFYLPDLDAVYAWVAEYLGVAEVVLRDKVQAAR